MQYYKKQKQSNNNNEYLKMTSAIKSDIINNVCFECGSEEPQYISINNAVFICKECIINHLSFSQEISQIILNDLYSLNLNEVKTIYLGGNRNLIKFINFDFPGLKQFPPDVLYKTLAVDYYRKNLKFLVYGGKKPLKPNDQMAYKLVEGSNNNILSPKINRASEKYLNFTQLTPILEGKDELDEKENDEDDKTVIEINSDFSMLSVPKEEISKKQNDDNIKNENDSTLVNTPQKLVNGNNNAGNIIDMNSQNNKTFENEKNKNSNCNEIINEYNNKNSTNECINHNLEQEKEEIEENLNINEEIKFSPDKNINEIKYNDENKNIDTKSQNEKSNLSNNLNVDVSGDDNTIKIVNGYINDLSDIKTPKDNNDSSSLIIKDEINDINNKSEKKIIRNDNKNDGFNKNGDNNNKEEKNITPIRIKRKNYYKNDDTTKKKNEIKEKEKDNIKNNSYIKSKRENKILKNEDRDDINCDDIKVNKKNVSKNIDIKTKPNEDMIKTKKIKRRNQYLDEARAKESFEEEEILKIEKIKNGRNPRERIDKLNLTEIKPNKHLKVKISTTQIIKFDDKDDDFGEYTTKKTKEKKITKERKDKLKASKEIIKREKNIDDFSSKKSSFLNPFKYLKKSFQKKQNEKFEINSDSSDEDSYEEEEKNGKTKPKNNFHRITQQRKKNNKYIDLNSDSENSSNEEEIE